MKKNERRIIHTIPAISEEASGPSYSVVRLCESLSSEEKEIELLSLDWSPMSSSPSFLRTFPVSMWPRRLGHSPLMKRWMQKKAQSGEIELIHNHSLWMMPNVYPGLVAKKYGVPLVVSPRGTMSEWAMQSGSIIKKIFWRTIQREALASVACFHATSESEYLDIRRMGFTQPVAIIPNGIDLPIAPHKKEKAYRTLLFFGRIHPVKGLDILLPAWREVQSRFPEWHLRIVGPGDDSYKHTVIDLASSLGVERVEFSGALYGDEKWRAYQDADLFVLPTHSENFGMSVAEALSIGTPCIVTKRAPWSGLETHQAGWWIDFGVDSLVVCLSEALNKPVGSLESMGLRGRDWMKTEFSWECIGRQMSETYRWIVNDCQKPDWVITE